MMLAELVVLIVLLAPGVSSPPTIARLGTLSFFAQWLALLNAAILCLSRRWLMKRTALTQTIAVGAIVLGTTLLVSHLVFVVDQLLKLELTLPAERNLEFVLGITSITGLVGAAGLRYWWIQTQWKRELRAQAEARVMALEARIRPHFLFNSMNTILSLIAIDPVKAERAVEDLSDLFRAALKHSAELNPLREEITLIERYLSIEKLRLGERLNVDIHVDPAALAVTLPGMILQPLVENAVYHGIQPRADGGVVSLHAQLTDGQLKIEIVNPLAPSKTPGGNGLALDNIRERLKLRYGRRASLTTREAGDRFIAQLTLPSDTGLLEE
jgi:two-component system, LytTR family, sensor histidine kinase AlgZ